MTCRPIEPTPCGGSEIQCAVFVPLLKRFTTENTLLITLDSKFGFMRWLGGSETRLSSLRFSGAEHCVPGKHPVYIHFHKARMLKPFELV
jgi:hypothetical protein